MFILEYKLKQSELDILQFPYWVAERRYKQYEEWEKEKQRQYDEEEKKIKRMR